MDDRQQTMDYRPLTIDQETKALLQIEHRFGLLALALIWIQPMGYRLLTIDQ